MVALPKTDISSLVATPLTCQLSTADLRRATATLARIVDKHSRIPMLANVLVKVTEARELVLAATDLNVSAVCTLDVYKGPPFTAGSICVNAKGLADLVKGLSGEHVTLGQTGGLGLAVYDDQTNVTLIGMHSRDFPKLPVAKPETRYDRTEGVAFADMLDRVSHAICKDETRFHLNGIRIESDGVTTRMVTTDGHRLTRHDAKLCTPTTQGVILPSKAATEIGKIFKAHKTDTAYLAIEGAFLFGRIGGWSIAAKLIDAQFPPYEQVIPKDHSKLATVEIKPLIAALKRAQKLTSKTRGVKLAFASGKLTLTCDHPEQGTATESMKACSEWLERGHTGVFGMNPSYLLDVLTEIGDKNATFEFGAELDPVLVRGTDDSISYSVAGSKFLGVVMPMRL